MVSSQRARGLSNGTREQHHSTVYVSPFFTRKRVNRINHDNVHKETMSSPTFSYIQCEYEERQKGRKQFVHLSFYLSVPFNLCVDGSVRFVLANVELRHVKSQGHGINPSHLHFFHPFGFLTEDWRFLIRMRFQDFGIF